MEPGAVLVWWTGVENRERAALRYAPFLSPAEKERADSYKSESRAAQFITGRGRLRMILSEITGVPPGDLAIVAGEHGKPVLAGEPGLHFSIAHSKDAALIAVTRIGPIGVDLEALRPVAHMERLARRWFTEDDVSYLVEAGPAERTARFFWLWTRKEALFKAWGTGISWESARRVSVRLDRIGPPAPKSRSQPAAGWWSIRSWSPRPGYAAAVAAPGDSWRLVMC